MKLNLMTKLIAASALTISAAAMALPSHEKFRCYYTDASMTVAAGEKVITLCNIGTVNQMAWGTATPYYRDTSTPCGGSTGPGDDDPIHCDRIRDVFC